LFATKVKKKMQNAIRSDCFERPRAAIRYRERFAERAKLIAKTSIEEWDKS